MIYNNYQIQKSQTFGMRHIPKEFVAKLQSQVAKAHTVKISPHDTLDHDAIYSAMVVGNWLKSLGKRVSLCFDRKDLKGLLFNKLDRLKIKRANQNPADLLFFVDYNSKERMPVEYKKLINEAKGKRIGIDHHIDDSTIDKGIYADDTAPACCALLYKFFTESLKKKIPFQDKKRLFCGILSDYRKSKLIEIKRVGKNYSVVPTEKLERDKDGLGILQSLESEIPVSAKNKICRHLDVLSSLTKDEKLLRKNIFSQIQVTPNGKLAYCVIEPNDECWAKTGMDNVRTSLILNDFRREVLNPKKHPLISKSLHKKLENTQGIMIFYRESNESSKYKMSITTKGDYADKLINYIRENLDSSLVAGGHPDRAGGSIDSVDKKDVDSFVQKFITAAEKVD